MTQTPGIPFRTRQDHQPEAGLDQAWIDQAITRLNRGAVPPEQDVELSDDWNIVNHEASQDTNPNIAAVMTEAQGGSTQPQGVVDNSTTTTSGITSEPTSPSGIDPLHDLELRVSNEFTPIKENDWDTVLYIGPPTQQHGQSEAEYNYITRHFARPYLMRSQTLRESGSAEFVRRLGPMSARVARKLKNLGLHQHLPNDGTPKYWIDLRPMQNDDEALLTIAELSCTPGVLGWHQHLAAQQVDPSVINGKDALNTPKGLTDGLKLPPNFFSKGATALKSGNQPGATRNEDQPFDDLEAEYSPLRHHTAIERLLYAIAGYSPKLNSAPKMWTFFAVAKMFDCARHPRVSSEIYTWIFSGVNSNFISVNPEVCYRIAMGTQREQGKVLLRVVFSILVGEKAFNQAVERSSNQPSSSVPPNRSRPLSHLDDDEVNRIDHAARALSLRMHQKFRHLNEYPFMWMSTSTELFKLLSLVGVKTEYSQIIHAAIGTILQHARNELLHALTQNLTISVARAAADDEPNLRVRRPYTKQELESYNALTLPQRLLNQISWMFIEDYSMVRDTSRFLTLGSPQYDGMYDIAGYQPKSLPINLGPQYEKAINMINNHIGDGYIHYNGIYSHQDHLGDYEVRWDALYAAAGRNWDSLSDYFSDTEKHILEAVAQRREQVHSQGVDAYEAAQYANPRNLHHIESDWRSKVARSTTTTDHYYTSAKIDSQALLTELSRSLKSAIDLDVLRQGYLRHSGDMEADINVSSIDTLMCLDDDEFRFLPLWADGCDDGTGGVFTETVPGAIDEDFQGGKRGLGSDDEGLDHLEDVEMGESFSVIDTQEAESTVAGASKVATAGCGTDSVMSMDE